MWKAYLKNSNLQYYYVFVPYEDDLVYIWDADAADTVDGTCPLGYHEEYMEKKKLKKYINKILWKKYLLRTMMYTVISRQHIPLFSIVRANRLQSLEQMYMFRI